MNCPKCGNEIVTNYKFCVKCGYRLESVPIEPKTNPDQGSLGNSSPNNFSRVPPETQLSPELQPMILPTTPQPIQAEAKLEPSSSPVQRQASLETGSRPQIQAPQIVIIPESRPAAIYANSTEASASAARNSQPVTSFGAVDKRKFGLQNRQISFLIEDGADADTQVIQSLDQVLAPIQHSGFRSGKADISNGNGVLKGYILQNYSGRSLVVTTMPVGSHLYITLSDFHRFSLKMINLAAMGGVLFVLSILTGLLRDGFSLSQFAIGFPIWAILITLTAGLYGFVRHGNLWWFFVDLPADGEPEEEAFWLFLNAALEKAVRLNGITADRFRCYIHGRPQ